MADLIEAAAAVAREDDLANRAALKDAWSSFMDAMPAFLATSKRGAVGESAIDDGTAALSALISKLNTLAIFAQAGQELEGVKRAPLPYDQLVSKVVQTLDKLGAVVQTLGKVPRPLPVPVSPMPLTVLILVCPPRRRAWARSSSGSP